MMKPKWGTPEYWKYWYWQMGGREKVQHSRKVTQPLCWNKNQQKENE